MIEIFSIQCIESDVNKILFAISITIDVLPRVISIVTMHNKTNLIIGTCSLRAMDCVCFAIAPFFGNWSFPRLIKSHSSS